ncbi:MAG: GNAT family N-acetyltransferase, partial [Hyphomicrobiaceae bacterium]
MPCRAILDHLLTVARSRGYRHISLETETGRSFDPAVDLYRKRGFVKGEAFGGSGATGFNQFRHLDLTAIQRPSPCGDDLISPVEGSSS